MYIKFPFDVKYDQKQFAQEHIVKVAKKQCGVCCEYFGEKWYGRLEIHSPALLSQRQLC